METKIDYDRRDIGLSEIHIATDHAGFELKELIVEYLEKNNYEVVDHGAYEYDDCDDYPDLIAPAILSVVEDPNSKGIVIGGSGQGEAIVANKFPGIRAVVFNGQYDPLDGREVPDVVITARQHNDANVLSLGARFLSTDDAIEAVGKFLETDFSDEERHIRRIQKLDNITRLIG